MRWWGRKQGEGAGADALSPVALSDSASFLAAVLMMSAWGHLDVQLRPQRRKTDGKTLIFKSIWRDSWTGDTSVARCRVTLPYGAVRWGGGWSPGVPGPPVPAWAFLTLLLALLLAHHWQLQETNSRAGGVFPLTVACASALSRSPLLAGAASTAPGLGGTVRSVDSSGQSCARREGRTRYTLRVSLQSPFCKN